MVLASSTGLTITMKKNDAKMKPKMVSFDNTVKDVRNVSEWFKGSPGDSFRGASFALLVLIGGC